MPTLRLAGLAASAAVVLAVVPAPAQVTTDAGTIDPADAERFFGQPGYSPYAGRSYPTRPLWREQHLHTSWSPDAIAGGTRVGPDEPSGRPATPSISRGASSRIGSWGRPA